MQNIKSTLSEPEPWGKERGEQDDGGRRAEVCVCVHHLIRSAPGLREGSSRLLPLSSKRAMQIGELDGGEGGVVRLAASPVPARHEPESDTAKGPQHPGRPRGSPRERCSKNGETHAAVPRLFPLRQGVLGGGRGKEQKGVGVPFSVRKQGTGVSHSRRQASIRMPPPTENFCVFCRGKPWRRRLRRCELGGLQCFLRRLRLPSTPRLPRASLLDTRLLEECATGMNTDCAHLALRSHPDPKSHGGGGLAHKTWEGSKRHLVNESARPVALLGAHLAELAAARR